jgi:hypothetical protein
LPVVDVSHPSQSGSWKRSARSGSISLPASVTPPAA